MKFFASPLQRLGLPSPPADRGRSQQVQIESESTDGRTVVTVEEWWLLDVSRSRQLGQQLTQLISDDQPVALEIDLTRVTRLTSEGLNQLIQVNCHARAQGTNLVLVNLNQPLADVFRLTRLDRLFAVERR